MPRITQTTTLGPAEQAQKDRADAIKAGDALGLVNRKSANSAASSASRLISAICRPAACCRQRAAFPGPARRAKPREGQYPTSTLARSSNVTLGRVGPQGGDWSKDRLRVENAIRQRAEQSFRQREDANRARWEAQGFRPGTAAYRMAADEDKLVRATTLSSAPSLPAVRKQSHGSPGTRSRPPGSQAPSAPRRVSAPQSSGHGLQQPSPAGRVRRQSSGPRLQQPSRAAAVSKPGQPGPVRQRSCAARLRQCHQSRTAARPAAAVRIQKSSAGQTALNGCRLDPEQNPVAATKFQPYTAGRISDTPLSQNIYGSAALQIKHTASKQHSRTPRSAACTASPVWGSMAA